MFNWIGLYLVNEIIYGRGSGAMYDAHNTRTWKLATNAPQAQIPSCGMSELFHTSNTTIAIFWPLSWPLWCGSCWKKRPLAMS